MRKWMNFLMTFLVASYGYVNAESSLVEFEAGYRHDSINWRANSDDVVSTKTHFKNIDIFQIGVNGRTSIPYNFYARASAHWGWIIDGDLEESTRVGFSAFPVSGLSANFEVGERIENVLDGKFVYDLDIAVGYPFYFCDYAMSVSPVVGYSVDEQNLRVEGNQGLVFEADSITGALVPVLENSCCHSRFISQFWGPFVGADFEYVPCDAQWSLYAAFEYHFARHKIKRHGASIGIDGFDNFHRHSRRAYGWVFDIGGEYEMENMWTVGLDFQWKDFRTTRRHHYFGDSSYGSTADLSIDGFRDHTTWHSYAISVTAGHRF